MAQLVLRAVSRRFGRTNALTCVDLTIEQGDFIAIEGSSGGGKSTLLNTIGLLDTPSSGSYAIDGSEMTDASPRYLTELRSDRFAFVFQSFHLLDRRPVIDSAELSLLYRGISRSERRRLALDALKRVGIAELAQQKSSTLSGGQRQRLAIARAFATNAPIIVADEPTGNLDSANSESIVGSLLQLNAEGRTVILVTHSADVAAAASRHVSLRDGRRTDREIEPCRTTEIAEPSGPPGRASRLRVADLVDDALASVRSRGGRSAGLVAAVAVGVALATATTGIAGSARAQVSDTFAAHANRDVTITWKSGSLSSQAEKTVDTAASRLADLAGVDGVGLLADHGGTTVQASPARETLKVAGYSGSLRALDAGRTAVTWAAGLGGALESNEVLVGRNLAKQLDLASLDSHPSIAVSGRDVLVAGIIDKSPTVPGLTGGVVVPERDAGDLEQEAAQFTALIHTASGAAQQVARQAPLVIDPYTPDGLAVDAPPDPSTLRGEIEADVQNTLLAFTVLALLGSIAGLGNAMVMSVLERRQELALRRAVGARPIHVSALVLVESIVIGAAGGIAGLTAGLAALLGLTIARGWIPVFDFRVAPLAIAGGIIVGALGGCFAAMRASRVEPHEALRL